MKVRLSFIFVTCFTFSTLLTSAITIKSVIDTYEPPKPPEKEYIIEAREITLPTEEELQHLNELHKKISSYSVNTAILEKQITESYGEVIEAKVCSHANKRFKSLKACYIEFEQQIAEIQSYLTLYENEYNTYLEEILQIPKYSHMHNEKYNEYIERFGTQYNFVNSQNKNYTEIYDMYIDAQRIANEFFDRDYEVMCHIIDPEAGICPSEERWEVCAILENREKDPDFPDTLYEVVFQPGQYEPVMTGSYYNPPSASVRRDVEKYLRGEVEVYVPENVVFQALFPQGSGVWKHKASGHYFCYK